MDSRALVQQYAYLSAEHLSAWVEKPAIVLTVDNTCHTWTHG
jgi:hypothetical protein